MAKISSNSHHELASLDERNRTIFQALVDSYLETGSPVGSRTLSKRLNGALSPATVRNIMSDLEAAGLLFAPHTSAGRQPTDLGMRMFVDGFMQLGDLTEEERAAIEGRCVQFGRSFEDMLTEASEMLSGLSGWAGLVTAPKAEAPLKHIEFVSLGDHRALVVMVTEAGAVENRMIEIPAGMPPSSLVEAGNYLNARLRGRTIEQARGEILLELESREAELNDLTARFVAEGLATWSGGEERPSLIVRGRANLFSDASLAGDLERIRQLFSDLDSKRSLMNLLELAEDGEGVRVFIGSESQLFSLSGSAVIVAPYSNSRQEIIGAIGVVGPTYLNYSRIVPMVDYTAQVIGKLVG